MRDSIHLLLRHQAPSDAFPACPTFSQYPYAWLRDSSFVAYALDRAGEHAAARYHRWAAGVIARLEPRIAALIAKRAAEPIGECEFPPTRFALSGEALGDDWPNFQFDGYGQWLWGLGEHLKFQGIDQLPPEFEPGARVTLKFLGTFWNEPCFDCWEEFPYRWHASTLASLYGGVKAMGRFLSEEQGLAERVRAFTLGHNVAGGALAKFAGFPVSDASLLWAAVPFGLLDVTDPVFQRTLAHIEADLVQGGVHRYAFDTSCGGGAWVLLSAWLGWVYARLGREEDAARMLAWVRAQDDGGGLPEQIAASPLNPACAAYWRERWGESARPLLWSHAMHIVLESELASQPTLSKAETA